MKRELLLTSFMKQSDPEFLEQYARWERTIGSNFEFYNYSRAASILGRVGITVPDTIEEYDLDELKTMLSPAKINAREAYRLSSETGRDVGHLAFAFDAY